MIPIVNEARKNYRGRINFVDANLDQPSGKELAKEHDVVGYPVLLLLDGDSNRVNVLQGVFPLSTIENALDELIAGE